MNYKPKQILFIVVSLAGLAIACNLPTFTEPTPFVFPTPDMTMTALFAPTEEIPVIPTEIPPTATDLPTETPLPIPTATALPTATNTAIPPTQVPPSHRTSPHIEAQYASYSPQMDGGWGNWETTEYNASYVSWDTDNWKNSDDLSASIKVLWDEQYLYVAWKVLDEKYVQISKGEYLYEGDSVEVLIDTYVQSDYWTQYLDWDDYQIGVSPGRNTIGNKEEAFVWFPVSKKGTTTKIDIGVKEITGGYRVTIAIPWSILGVTPYNGARFGFAASVSDDDSKNGGVQQSMVSTSPYRILTDPTTWGDLILVK